MTTTVFAGPFPATHPEPGRSRRRQLTQSAAAWKLALSAWRRPRRNVRAAGPPSTPPGPAGAAVITAARRSAGLSRRTLARRLAVPGPAVRAWEDGSKPLFCTGYGQLRHLAAALTQGGAGEPAMLHTLLLATRCDLLIFGMLHGIEDYAEVPPIEENTPDGETCRHLLHWAFTGAVPPQYRQHAPARPLIAAEDVSRLWFRGVIMQAGAWGDDLRAFGETLAALTKAEDRKEQL